MPATPNSEELVDRAPAQVYATLLAHGAHLCSTATMYRVLRANSEVAERRRTARHGIPHVAHADRGTSMTSETVADLLEDLAVTRSHSRPTVSNDNPRPEASFTTAKCSPTCPERFATLKDARAWMANFTAWYDYDHHRSGIGSHVPADVHHARTGPVDAIRAQTLAGARAAHPERFTPATALPAAPNPPTTTTRSRARPSTHRPHPP